MEIALIDNELIKRDNHNFPNLALMKISSYLKNKGHNVRLVGFDEIDRTKLFFSEFDKIYISKAFTDTPTPNFVYEMVNVQLGGTGFFYDKSEKLDDVIEHSMPDYSLYDCVIDSIKNRKYYTDFSIGFTTRGCFRKCPFCVNKNSTKVNLHSPIQEFLDVNKPKISMLDDNILGLSNSNLFGILEQFKSIGKPIQYKQGMDIRLISDERARKIIDLKYEGDYYFAFDMWDYRDLIVKKLKIWHDAFYIVKNSRSLRISTNFYVFCAFDYNNKYDINFWVNDIRIIFERIKILFEFGCLPFVMRHENWKSSPFRDLYITITQWSNQPANCAKYSFLEYAEISGKNAVFTFLKNNKQFNKLFMLKIRNAINV